ncbi:MAG: alpha/beta hydrolase [Anaerolineae bacterium]|nr:alpha/beta hydrolase [Anaerolineae bacterium]
MKLDFSNKTMDIGTFAFNFVRTLMVAGTGGAELNECLLVAGKIKDNDSESWVQEWRIMADKVAGIAEHAMRLNQTVTARQAYLRASNYYRTAMFSLPHTDARLDQYLTLSRECFHKAARLSSPPVEIITIPFGDALLPGYFLSAGSAQNPTLIVLNGGDSTNEEMVHWIGFAAVARGWNCITFEGPGQWSALQLNPGLYMRHDYEAPVKAVVDYLVQRGDVDQDKIALFGPSLGSVLAARAATFEPRIKACVCSGLIVDVYEGWHAVWPAVLQKAPPAAFDAVFSGLEKVSPQLHGMANHFRWMLGVSKPHEIIDAWRPYNIKQLAPKMHFPLLLVYGEGEAAQSNEQVGLSVLRFVKELSCPVTIHLFSFEDGWAASHCQIGALAPLQMLVFDWLDKVINASPSLPLHDMNTALDVFTKYMHSDKAKLEAAELVKQLRAEFA